MNKYIIALIVVGIGILGASVYLISDFPEPRIVGGTPTPETPTPAGKKSDTPNPSPPPPPGSPATTISLANIKSCIARGSESGKCLDLLFREYLTLHSTLDALSLLRQYEAEDTHLRVACHPMVHALGRETFLQKKTIHDAFAACDQTCHSGCYHGAMERFLRGDRAIDDERHVSESELLAKAKTACDPSQESRFRFQCLHGLGHALMFFLDYQLEKSLAACESLGDSWTRSSCYGGIFMENVFTATPEKRDLSKTDYHYPCSKLDDKYDLDCYMMQTTRMTEMGLSTEQLFTECRKAGVAKSNCMQSIGRDLSNDVRAGSSRSVSQKCEQGTAGAEREACTRGVIYALIDNTWDGRYAIPYCATYAAAADQQYCYRASLSYLKATFAKTRDELFADCNAFAAGNSACTDAASIL